MTTPADLIDAQIDAQIEDQPETQPDTGLDEQRDAGVTPGTPNKAAVFTRPAHKQKASGTQTASGTPGGEISLRGRQAKALDGILHWYQERATQVFYLAGFAGTGKSTIVDQVIRRLRSEHGKLDVRTVTFTGKAADVLRRRGVENTSTIHSLIYRVQEDPATGELLVELDPNSEAATCDLIVVDEASMVDEQIAEDLLSFGKPILVVADPGQLPPVHGKPGFTAGAPDVFLDEIHRQAWDNPIIRISKHAREGERIPMGDWGQGVRVMPFDATSGPYVLDRETQVICGVHRVRWALTQRMRRAFGYQSRLPEAGERVICRRNDKEAMLFNGQLGCVETPPAMPGRRRPGQLFTMSVQVDGHDDPTETSFDPYLFDEHFAREKLRPSAGMASEFHHWDWGWVITGHQSQGSQWWRTTVIDDSRSFRADARRWLYTAVTRAESEMTLLMRR